MSDLTMYDSVGNHYPGPNRAAYGNGRYANVTAALGGGGKVLLTIDVDAQGIGNCLDVETGDATPGSAPGWVRKRIAAGVAKPWVYCNLSTWPSVIAAFKAAGLSTSAVYWWIADYTNKAHYPTCQGITANGCQYAGGITAAYDTSCMQAAIFEPPAPPPVPPPAPAVTKPAQIVPTAVPTPEEAMAQLDAPIVGIIYRPQKDGYWLYGQDGGVYSFGGAPVYTDPDVGKLTPGHMVTGGDCTPTGAGLVLCGSDGAVLAFGDAVYINSLPGLGYTPSTEPIEA